MTIKKEKRVMGFGTFDKIHPGHLDYLSQLSSLGKEVYVVVARNENVERFKGKKAALGERQRFDDLRQTKMVDHVILGNKKNIYQCLRDYKPNVIGLGYDQRADEATILEILPEVKIVRLKPYKPETYKSSLLAEQSQ